MAEPASDFTPVTLVTGFLGSGKTTLLQQLLRDPALADSAKRALLFCQPFTMLRPDHYDQWKDLELKFDPQELLGG